MSVRKTPGGRWRGVVKSGREQVASKTFNTRREALAWVARERAALAGGVDPRAGRRTVRVLVPEWLQEREHAVSRKTFVSDSALPRLMPPALSALQIGAVTDREVTRALIALNKSGLAESSVKRFRASLSAFFAWAVRERLITANPVTGTRVPKGRGSAHGDPAVRRGRAGVVLHGRISAGPAAGRRTADRVVDGAALVRAPGGAGPRLRARAVAGALVSRAAPEAWLPVLLVSRAAPEGVEAKVTKSGKSRRVPVADRVLPLVQAARREGPGRPAVHDPDRAPAARLSGQAVGRLVDSRARPTHPRPAAHCGVSLAGQGSGPGDGPGVAGARVDRHDEHLPAPPRLVCGQGRTGASERAGGRGGCAFGEERRMTKQEPRPCGGVSAGGTGFRCGGAEGIRTPDLLIANETRYQLRHSPEVPR